MTEYKLYPRRWIVLTAFSVCTFTNAWMWITWSPITNQVAVYWNVSVGAVDAISSTYMWVYLPMCFVAMYLIVDVVGLAKGIWIGSTMTAVGALIRLAGMTNFWYVYFGHVLCATAQTFLLTIPPMLAAKWFGDHERTTATAIGVLSNQFGTSAGLGSTILINLVDTATNEINPTKLRGYLLFQFLLMATSTLVLVTLMRQDGPPTPPNASEALRREQKARQTAAAATADGIMVVDELTALKKSQLQHHKDENGNMTITTLPKGDAVDEYNPSFASTIKLCLRYGWAFALVYGLSVGTFYSIPTFISQFVPTWAPSAAGWLGLAYQTTGVCGSYIVGRVADRYQNHSFLSRFLIFLMTLSWGSFGLFRNHCPAWFVFATVMTTGFCLASSSTLGFEIGARITYPANEATMGAVMQFVAQLVSFLSVTFGGWIGPGSLYIFFCWGCMSVALGILLSISTESKRPT